MARPVRCPVLDSPGSFVELEHRQAVLRAYMTFPDTALSISSGGSEERKGKNAYEHVHAYTLAYKRTGVVTSWPITFTIRYIRTTALGPFRTQLTLVNKGM